ncbi:MAG TPA: hypothetical protein VGE00_08585, partial [Gammaproteobacteria bacterium]
MLWFGLSLWLCLAAAMSSLAAEQPTVTESLLQDVVRLSALPQSPEITAQLQLLHALIEIDLGMTEAAEARLEGIRGHITVTETVEQLRLLLAVRRRQLEGRSLPTAALRVELPGLLAQERQLILALQRQAEGDTLAAITMVNQLRRDDPFHTAPFLSVTSLDLALLLLQAGQTDYAIDLLQLLGSSSASDVGTEQLRDRANLVLARTLLTRGMSDMALGVVERVRLDGPDGSAALLLLGWVKLEAAGPGAA